MSRGISSKQKLILEYLKVHGKATINDLAYHILRLDLGTLATHDLFRHPTESEKSSIRRSLRNLKSRGHIQRSKQIRNGTWTLMGSFGETP